jgi:hypothetical protein
MAVGDRTLNSRCMHFTFDGLSFVHSAHFPRMKIGHKPARSDLIADPDEAQFDKLSIICQYLMIRIFEC